MPTKPTTTQENYEERFYTFKDLDRVVKEAIKQERLTLLKQIQEFECMKEEEGTGGFHIEYFGGRNSLRKQLNEALDKLIEEER